VGRLDRICGPIPVSKESRTYGLRIREAELRPRTRPHGCFALRLVVIFESEHLVFTRCQSIALCASEVSHQQARSPLTHPLLRGMAHRTAVLQKAKMPPVA
jgi:hypothetical protein